MWYDFYVMEKIAHDVQIEKASDAAKRGQWIVARKAARKLAASRKRNA